MVPPVLSEADPTPVLVGGGVLVRTGAAVTARTDWDGVAVGAGVGAGVAAGAATTCTLAVPSLHRDVSWAGCAPGSTSAAALRMQPLP